MKLSLRQTFFFVGAAVVGCSLSHNPDLPFSDSGVGGDGDLQLGDGDADAGGDGDNIIDLGDGDASGGAGPEVDVSPGGDGGLGGAGDEP